MELFAELCPADLSDRLAYGVAEVLSELGADGARYRHSLVTGNFEQVARIKLDRAGIGHWFERGQGAFGSDHESRARLPGGRASARGRLAARAHGRDRRHPARHRLRPG